jgi:uncharacterized protein GlcG (DUF336 family)
MALSYEQAERALRAAIERARELAAQLGIAVVDERGYSVAVGRMDGTRAFAADVATGKARAAALFGVPSGAIEVSEQVALATAELHGGRLVRSQGGVPIRVHGELVGGIGAGGSSAANDEIAAQAGADAIAADERSALP